MEYDVIVVGAGISGLTAGSLLAKRGLKICVIDAQYKPGGSCGIFKREDNIFEQGVGMLYGFGEKGFCPHRFVFNALEEPIDMIKHNELYAINYGEHRVVFYEDLDLFIDELVKVFPKERKNFKKFYRDLSQLYMKVIAENPTFISADVVKKENGLEQIKAHPLAYLKFLSFMNKDTEKLLKKYFKDPEVFKFFNKLTSTYCYTTVKETPAVLSAVMFVDNHYGGSYYPAGSTIEFIGKLEKVIEEHDGDMIYNKEVIRIIIEKNKVIGVELEDGDVIKGTRVIYSGNVWGLYNKLIKDHVDKKRITWANSLVPTYTSIVFFALVKEEVIPRDTLPIEMLIGSKENIDEGEITVYLFSIDDKSLCKKGYHTLMAIGPTFKKWPLDRKGEDYHKGKYEKLKELEKERVINVLDNRFPGFREGIIHCELSTPCTLQRYILKHKGATAGVKQQLGQHMLKRLHIKGDIEGLYNCGESTVMGTGTPAVTISGISATNLILREMNLEEYEYKENMKQYVNIIKPPYIKNESKLSEIVKLSSKCQFCQEPKCQEGCPYGIDIRDINRRAAVGNLYGARKILNKNKSCIDCKVVTCEKKCIRNDFAHNVEIQKINLNILNKEC